MKAIALLSGGIDSPVAVAKLQKKLDIIAVSFHQEPLSNGEEIRKVKALTKHLNIKKLYLIPFIDVLKQLVDKCNHKNYFVLQKILMFQAAELIAKKEQANYLITGENLAQVSSQTLTNLTIIQEHINLPILQPLLTYDKQEIIHEAIKLSTYDISKGPEMCNLLGPKSPATKASRKVINYDLNNLDLPIILEEAIKKAEVISLK